MNNPNVTSPSDTSIIRAKDLRVLTGCGEHFSYKLLKDIKKRVPSEKGFVLPRKEIPFYTLNF